MTDAAVCELDGCTNAVERLPGSIELRRYCCAAHRKMARKGYQGPLPRLLAATSGSPTPVPAAAPAPGAATNGVADSTAGNAPDGTETGSTGTHSAGTHSAGTHRPDTGTGGAPDADLVDTGVTPDERPSTATGDQPAASVAATPSTEVGDDRAHRNGRAEPAAATEPSAVTETQVPSGTPAATELREPTGGTAPAEFTETEAPANTTASPGTTAVPDTAVAPDTAAMPVTEAAPETSTATMPVTSAEPVAPTQPSAPVETSAPLGTALPAETAEPAVPAAATERTEPAHVVESPVTTEPHSDTHPDHVGDITAPVPVLAAVPSWQSHPSPASAQPQPDTRTDTGAGTTSRRNQRAARPAAVNKRLAKKRDAPINPRPVIQAAWLGEAREALSAALHSLTANRLRSLLTTIGIIAGVASVIMLVAMGNGMEKGFNDQFSQFATQLNITPITGPVATGKAPQHLTDEDFHSLQDPKNAPDIAMLSAAVASNSVTLTVGQQKSRGELYGIMENYLILANKHMVAGSWFTDREISDGVRRAVVGPEVVNELWGPGFDPRKVIGLPLRVGHSTFVIQGVVNSDGQTDDLVMVPLIAARAYVVGNNAGKLDAIIAKSSSIATLDLAKNEIYQILYTQHHVRQDTDRDFNVTDFTNVLEQQMATIKFLQMFIVAIAGISLFVGGVGVANIMLVSVTERTREIGIRKAIGAPRRAIMRQFLSEAVMLTALGGLVGVVLGIGLCLLGKVVIPKLWPADPSSLTPTPLPILSLSPVLIAFGVSLVIGLLAGGYPAFRASRLRPIQALRFE
jgi:ABC-type antimicrobial peptide transport system permease subunit